MTKKKTNPKEECQGRYYVKGYETDDGKKVEGYYRTCWKHGANGSSAQETDPEEDGTHYPKNIPTKGIDELGIPLLGQNTPTEENSHPVWDIIGTVIGMAPEIFLKYMEYKAQADKMQVSFAPINPNYFIDNSTYGTNQTTSKKFDIKKTEEEIKNAMSNVSGILKKKEISTNDIGNIKGNLLTSIKNICNDMEYLSEKKTQLPQNPTMETVEESINIDNDRKQARENVYQIILMMTQANRALEKSFEPVNTSDSDYGEKLKNFVHQKEDFKKISDNLSSLYDITEGINDNTNGKIERVKGNLGIQDSTYNGITGGANNIYNKLAFENVYIPLENNNDNQTTLQGHVEKSDENIKEINYEIEKLEKQSDFSENNIEEIIEKENEIINDICETCENLYNEDNNVEVSNNQKKQIEENINETIKINNKIEKISLENEKISFSLKTQIRQIGINLYNLYISIKNRQKATIIRELYKLKVAIKSTKEEDKKDNTDLEDYKYKNQKWIMPCYGEIVSKYGEQRSTHTHNGIDIAVPVGTPIKAVADGTVYYVGDNDPKGYGQYIIITHNINGKIVTSEYGHLSSWNVQHGQQVKKEQVIAKSGNTGHSEGPHLHLTIREGKYKGKAVNPNEYIKY